MSTFAEHVRTALCLLLILGLCVLIVYWIIPVKTRYAWEYDTITNDVFISAKPHDCEFLTAPMGRKNCHYAKHVEAVKWQPDPDRVYFQSKVVGPDHSDAFSSIPAERVEDAHTKVYVTWIRESDE
jgi:hypothetical protein